MYWSPDNEQSQNITLFLNFRNKLGDSCMGGYIHYVQTFCTVLFSNLFYKSRINLLYETYFVIVGVEKTEEGV